MSDIVGNIHIAALCDDSVCEHEQMDSVRNVWRVRLITRKLPKDMVSQLIKYLEWMLRIFIRYRRSVHIVHCHDLSALAVGVLFKWLTKTKIIYDAHELETESNGLNGVRKKLAALFEKILIKYADKVIVVSDSISAWYRNFYSLNQITVIKNIPKRINLPKESNGLRNIFNIQSPDILFIYQGGLTNGRGVKIILNAFAKVDKTRHIVFMGYGPLEPFIRNFEMNYPNIHFHPAVKPDEVLLYTRSADVGISLIENTCLSYFYSLPNKVFEYLLSGLPIIVSDFPDMGALVDRYNCGWKVEPEISKVLNLINNVNIEEVNIKKENALKCRDLLSWENEEAKLKKLYKGLLCDGMSTG